MEIILSKSYPSLGFVGDRVSVKSGYARNFLIPQGIGVEATSRNAKQLRHKMKQIEAARTKARLEAEEIASGLKAIPIEFTLKIGEHGKSFGSLGTRDIEALLKEKGFELSRKQILLGEQIKSGGTFDFQVKLHSDVIVDLKAHVTVDLPKTSTKKKAEVIEETPAAEEAFEEDFDSEDLDATEED